MKKIFSAFAVITFSGFYAVAQVITTIAGTGIAGHSGDHGMAIAAELNEPVGLFADNMGSIFIADGADNCIRKISADGIINTIIGTTAQGYSGDGGMAAAAELNWPAYIVIDRIGNIYIADVGNNCIRKVDALGIIHTIAGNGVAGYTGDQVAATASELNDPAGLAVDGAGNVYIADADNNRIRKVSTSGIISTIAGTGGIHYSGDGGPATLAELYQPNGVVVDDYGNLIFASNNTIRKIDPSGIITTVAGNASPGFSGDNGPATAAELENPGGVSVTTGGVIYFCDVNNQRIRKVDASGIITTIAGNGTGGDTGDGGPATAAALALPNGTCFDPAGNLLFTEFGGNRVRKITYNLAVTPVSGLVQEVSVYPNPATSILYFEFPPSGDISIKLMDVTGRLANEQTVHNISNAYINVKNYTPGIYLYQVVANGMTKTGKIVVGN